MLGRFCEHPKNRLCCPACCHHCWLNSQDSDVAFYERTDNRWPDWMRQGAGLSTVRSAHTLIEPQPGDNPHAWTWAIESLDLNEHGVHGLRMGSGSGERFVPDVCLRCPFMDSDGPEMGAIWYFCTKFMFFPTRKGTCKVYEKEVSREKSGV